MIYDILNEELASVLAGGSLSIPTHVGFSSTALTLDPTQTTLSGEFGSRIAVSASSAVNVATFSGVRSGAIASSSGDRINAIGSFSASSSGNLYAVVLVSSVLHTTDFDFEVDWNKDVSRG